MNPQPSRAAKRPATNPCGLPPACRAQQQHLSSSNMRLVHYLARHYLNRGLPHADLIQEGTIGLMRAAEKFNPKRGIQFSTYAAWWIRQAMVRAIESQIRTIRIPLYKMDHLHRVRQAKKLLEKRFQREPTSQEVADYLEIDHDEVVALSRVITETTSLSNPVKHASDATLSDFIPDTEAAAPGEQLDAAMLREHIDTALATLSCREEKVLRMRYGLGEPVPYSLEEIGARFGLTRERIRQIEIKALRKLRHKTRCRALKTFAQGD